MDEGGKVGSAAVLLLGRATVLLDIEHRVARVAGQWKEFGEVDDDILEGKRGICTLI